MTNTTRNKQKSKSISQKYTTLSKYAELSDTEMSVVAGGSVHVCSISELKEPTNSKLKNV